jgi:acyl-CoA thioester hydrolase
MTHRMQVRVYYEDTDLGGIVYYANYLKFIERGRTEFLRDLGVDQMALQRDKGLVFAVRKLAAEYLVPARMDDLLTVETAVSGQSGASVTMSQRILRGEVVVFNAEVLLVAIGASGRAVRIPPIFQT